MVQQHGEIDSTHCYKLNSFVLTPQSTLIHCNINMSELYKQVSCKIDTQEDKPNIKRKVEEGDNHPTEKRKCNVIDVDVNAGCRLKEVTPYLGV